MNLGYTRTSKQAIGFYIVWFLIFVVAGGVIAGIGSILIGTPGGTFSQGYAVDGELEVLSLSLRALV